MFVFKDYKLYLNTSLRNSLKVIYGMGFNKASYLCDLFGYGLSYRVNLLNRVSFSLMSVVLRKYYILGGELKRAISTILHKYISINSYRGIRIKFFLPVRGQRTHSNYKTVRKLGKFKSR